MTGSDKTLEFVISCNDPNASSPHIDSQRGKNVTGSDKTLLSVRGNDGGSCLGQVLLATTAKYAKASIEGHLEVGHEVAISLEHLLPLAL